MEKNVYFPKVQDIEKASERLKEILATVCAKKEAGENVDFMPLTVDYQEKYASTGRFPGGFFKREAR